MPEFPARFLLYVGHTITSEIGHDPDENGGWNHHPSDHGGPTQWGIAANYNPKYAEKIKKKKLSYEEALGIYYNKYYKPIYNIDKLPPSIGFILFDARVHGSIRTDARDLQTLVNVVSGARLKTDGVYGPKTYRAISQLSGPQLTSILSMMRMTVPFRAEKVAKSTMRSQKRKGLRVTNYTNGFRKRFNDRINQALRYA